MPSTYETDSWKQRAEKAEAALADVPSLPVGYMKRTGSGFIRAGRNEPPSKDELDMALLDNDNWIAVYTAPPNIRADTIRECAEHLYKKLHDDDGDNWQARFAYNSLLSLLEKQ